MSTPPSPSVAPGWYSDPYVARTLRYHDGNAWTQHVAPAAAAQPIYSTYPTTAPLGANPSDPVHWLLPIGRTWQSITASYIALFALVIWPLGPVALGFGTWALMVSTRTGAHGRGRAVFAVIVGGCASLAMMALVLS